MKNFCDSICTCRRVPKALLACSFEAAAGIVSNCWHNGSQQEPLDFRKLLPQLAGALSSEEWELGKGHSHSARHATLDTFDKSMVTPLCAKLSSQDPTVVAAARSEAVAAALATSRSGLPKQLHTIIPVLLARLTAVVVQELKPAEAFLHRLTPADAVQDVQKAMQQCCAVAACPSRLRDLLHELQLTCCWVTALARIWPGSILAAPAGVGPAAASTLMLCARYLECVRHMQHINELLEKHQQQQDMQQQDMQQQGQQQQGQQQQLQLLQLPAADITAAVLHTASLLLADLGKHIADKTSPQHVPGLLLNAQALHQTAVVVATLFGSQLQLHLLHQLRQLDSQVAQHSSSGGSSGSNSGSSIGSSSGPPGTAAELAEGVLLCHAQRLQPPQSSVPHPQLSSPMVQSWLQHIEASWGEVLPPHQLLHIAAAIAAAGVASAPQQHPDTSTSSAVQEGQPYKLLLPEHCLEDAAATAGSASTAAGVSAGSSSRSGGRGSSGGGSSGGGGSGSGSGSGSGGLIDTQQCIQYVEAAARLLGLGSTEQQGLAQKPQPLCQHTNSVGVHRLPVLLLSSAVAALSLTGAAAMYAAWRCSVPVKVLMDAFWCEGNKGRPCLVCTGLLRPLAWPTVGLLSLLVQQITDAGDRVHSPALSSSSGNSSSGSSSSESSSSGNSGSRSSSSAAATTATYLPNFICYTSTLMVRGVSHAVQLGPPHLLPLQLQQVSMALQVLEAALRCSVRLRQQLSQRDNAAAAPGTDGDAGFSLEPMLPTTASMCSFAVNVAEDSYSYSATPGDMASEVQQVLQAVMSLYHTALSTAQGNPGAAVPGVFVGCVKMHRLLLQYAVDAAAGATQPLSAATVAAGWFVLGRCLLQLSEQIQLCYFQPERYPLTAWLLTSARAWNSTCRTVFSGDSEPLVVRHQLEQLQNDLSLLAGAAVQWQRCLAHQIADINSSSPAALKRYQLNMIAVDYCLTKEASQVFATMTDPDVLAAILDPSPTHQQQILQRQEGPALQAFLALSKASSTLNHTGKLLCEALPNRYFCNNPGCRNAAGVSAGFALVRGAACVCGGCVGSEGAAGAAAAPQETVAARYCSVACQQQHWPVHRQQCPLDLERWPPLA